MTEHTPTPWRVEKGTGLVWGDCTIFEDGTPDRLGIPVTDGQLERPWGKGDGPTYDEMEANAAFIVKAVNNHDTLVKALDEAVRLIDALLGLERGSADAALAFIGRHGAPVSTPPKGTEP